MSNTITCLLPYMGMEPTQRLVHQLACCPDIKEVHVIATREPQEEFPTSWHLHVSPYPQSSQIMRDILQHTDSSRILYMTRPSTITMQTDDFNRLCHQAMSSDAALFYCDYTDLHQADGTVIPHPLIDYQLGSVRDNFDFGPLVFLHTDKAKAFYSQTDQTESYHYAGFYQLRLWLSHNHAIFHLSESLYTEILSSSTDQEQEHFAYVNPSNAAVQKEMEQAFIGHLSTHGLLLPNIQRKLDLHAEPFATEASVIIPVKNRAKTIGDAIRSALSQHTDFPFNVIVVDNHSTDGTSEVIDSLSTDPRLIHLIPEPTHLGIGGCWNYAVRHHACGKFAVQLDSDDLYKDHTTLAQIVAKFYDEQCGLVIGSYEITDFALQPLPPGLISHSEWTNLHGKDNALRINGLGAPRAFYTPLLREVGFPNISYGEDYATVLHLTRSYRVGRIYHSLYLCRRWEGNSDANLSLEKANLNNYNKDRIRTNEILARRAFIRNQQHITRHIHDLPTAQSTCWPLYRQHADELSQCQKEIVHVGRHALTIMHNPLRKLSTTADTSTTAIQQRPCFLCAENRPKEQISYTIHQLGYTVLVNPYPITSRHLTVVSERHEPQRIAGHLTDMLLIAFYTPQGYTIYNGPRCGASAPDHLHFQVLNDTSFSITPQSQVPESQIIIQTDSYAITYDDQPSPRWTIYSADIYELEQVFVRLTALLGQSADDAEPMMNLAAQYTNGSWALVVYPRIQHRPACYSAEGSSQLLISPATAEMTGYFPLIREADYQHVQEHPELLQQILQEVSITPSQAQAVNLKLKHHDN